MSTSEINELLRLKGWSRTKLAAELDLTENCIHQWMSGRRNPSGPAAILLRLWLEDARQSNGHSRPRQPAAR